MPVSSLQAAIIALIVAVVGVVVAFGIIDNETAGIAVTSATALVGAIFLLANAIIHHGIPGDPNSALTQVQQEAKANTVALPADGVDKDPGA